MFTSVYIPFGNRLLSVTNGKHRFCINNREEKSFKPECCQDMIFCAAIIWALAITEFSSISKDRVPPREMGCHPECLVHKAEMGCHSEVSGAVG